jgi:MFS family permease
VSYDAEVVGRRASIQRRTVVFLGLSQLICWGISYYLIGVFGDRIAADLGWSRSLVHGGFSAALLVMAISSRLAGRLIDRHGGRRIMVVGSLLTALGCVTLSLSRTIPVYYAAWALLGLAMRLTLYDAAFAALARIGGPEAKSPISQITLLGGLASTTFWPIGHLLAQQLGWRGAVLCYAGFALLTIPLHATIPDDRHAERGAASGPGRAAGEVRAGTPPDLLARVLYALVVMGAGFLNSGMSAHMIGLLTGLGVAATVAVSVATLRGIGQSLARLGEVLSGSRLHALDLNLLAALILPVCFVAGLWSGQLFLAAAAFAFLYGAGNGLSTITRGTLPLVLFDPRAYGAIVGQLLVPSFLAAAVAPIAYAFVIERAGDRAALYLSLGVAAAMLAAAVALKATFGGRGRS